MKKKLKLTKLTRKETCKIRGGEWVSCICACAYVQCGGSSSHDDGVANCDEGKNSKCVVGCCHKK